MVQGGANRWDHACTSLRSAPNLSGASVDLGGRIVRYAICWYDVLGLLTAPKGMLYALCMYIAP